VTGAIAEINTALEGAPELINQDPYGEGWLVVVELTDWDNDTSRLLDAETYYALIKRQAEEEMEKK